jgi:hypothetical protein
LKSLQEALKSLVSGTELTPVPENLLEPISAQSNFQKRVQKEPGIIADYEGLLEGWIAQVQTEIDDSEKQGGI